MKHSAIVVGLSLASLATAGKGKSQGKPKGKGKSSDEDCKPMVTSEALQDAVTIEDMMGHCAKFQEFADAYPEKNRHTSSAAHNETVDYIYNTIAAMSDYWDVELQPFNATIQIYGNANLTVNDKAVNVSVMENSPSGTFDGYELVIVDNLGCEQSDYPDTLEGKVALISRGECTFSSKSARAGVAGAVAAIVYNNVEGTLSGTLGGEDEIGPHIPTSGMSMEDGLALVELVGSEDVSINYAVDTLIETVYTNNVIATTKVGIPENTLFLGAHSDSVYPGPGINDNGSGSASLLAIAKALYGFATSSRIRLAWWSAEEHGLLGSEYYVTTASNQTLEEIRLYLNFDMIASPNYVLAVYDGSGEAFNLTGPAGSAEAQVLFESWFESNGYSTVPTEFNGRSDYGPFLDAGVPCGGLFTGAEEIKTEEEAELFGGQAGVALDENYHAAGDDYSNLNAEAFEINGKAIAHAVATYGSSFEGFPAREPITKKFKVKKRSHAHTHGPKKRAPGVKGVTMSCGGHGGDPE